MTWFVFGKLWRPPRNSFLDDFGLDGRLGSSRPIKVRTPFRMPVVPWRFVSLSSNGSHPSNTQFRLDLVSSEHLECPVPSVLTRRDRILLPPDLQVGRRTPTTTLSGLVVTLSREKRG